MFYKKFYSNLDIIAKLGQQVSLNIIFQPPWTKAEIAFLVQICNKKNIILHYDFKEYRYQNNKVPLVQMRNDSCLLDSEADYYWLVDDDIQWNFYNEKVGLTFLDLFNTIDLFLKSNENCGCIINNYAINYNNLLRISLYQKGEHISTGLFMICKNSFKNKNLVPLSLLDKFGGQQDVLCCLCHKVYNHEDIYCVDSVGFGKHKENGNVFGASKYKWNINDLKGSAREWCRENYSKIEF